MLIRDAARIVHLKSKLPYISKWDLFVNELHLSYTIRYKCLVYWPAYVIILSQMNFVSVLHSRIKKCHLV